HGGRPGPGAGRRLARRRRAADGGERARLREPAAARPRRGGGGSAAEVSPPHPPALSHEGACKWKESTPTTCPAWLPYPPLGEGQGGEGAFFIRSSRSHASRFAQ